MDQLGEGLRFQVLGPVGVSAGRLRLKLPGNVARRVLTTLMLCPGTVLSTVRLAQAVWGSSAPVTAPHQVRKAVAQLRQVIPGVSELLVTDGPGYRLQVGASESDLVEFNTRRAEARSLSEVGADDAEVLVVLQRALELFRGPVAADVVETDETDSGLIRSAALVVEERRLAAQKELIQLRMRMEPSHRVIGDLRDLVGQHPLEEELRAQLMTALYRCGRQADALSEYAAIRTTLADELGIDPNRQLVDLHASILRGEVSGPDVEGHADPGSASPEAPGTVPEMSDDPRAGLVGAAGPRPWPCTLPHELTDFVGRREEVDKLTRIARAGSCRSGPLVVAIDGMGGSGKTAVALRAAHRLAEDYPDGQFYVDLRGFSTGGRPSEPGDVLGVLLRTVGVDPSRLPVDLDDRVAMWRAVTAQAQVLLVLDNAASEDQILRLFPPGPGSLVLVTSRRRMPGLDGSQLCTVPPMSPGDSFELIAGVLGEQTMVNDPQATAELISQCGGLPLALRLATAKLRSRPAWTMAHLVERLSSQEHRPGELCAGDRSVRSMLQVSYDALPPEQQRALRMLGLLPTGSTDVYAAAALLDVTPSRAQRLLESLLDANLLEQRDINRYVLHDLVGGFAASAGEDEEKLPPAERRAALERLMDYYVAVSAAACAILYPARCVLSAAPLPAGGLPEITGRDEAIALCDHELGTMLAALEMAQHEGFLTQTVQLARDLMFVLLPRNNLAAYHRAATAAAVAARQLAVPDLLRVTLTNLAAACWRVGQLADGTELATEALTLAREQGASDGEAICHNLLGLLLTYSGSLDVAEEHLVQAVERPAHQVDHQIYALCNLSSLRRAQGRAPEAVQLATRALELSEQQQLPAQQAIAVTDLAAALLAAGDPRSAYAQLQPVIGRDGHSAMPETYAQSLALLAEACLELGRPEEADRMADRAMAVVHQLSIGPPRVSVQNAIGTVYAALGRIAEARVVFQRASEDAAAVGCLVEELRAVDGLDSTSAARTASNDDGSISERRELLRERLSGAQPVNPARD